MRYTIAGQSAAGFIILDGLRMRTFYYDARGKEEAQAYVGVRNLIERLRVDAEAQAATAGAALMREFMEGNTG